MSSFFDSIWFKILIIMLVANLILTIIELWPKNEVVPKQFESSAEVKAIYFCPEQSCEQPTIEQINLANESVHCANYNIALDSIKDAFVAAKKKGLDVKLVSDNVNAKNKASKIPELQTYNIVKLDNSDSAYMHNKFCVFDGNKVLLGSFNYTFNAEHKANNDIIIIENKNLANNFENEFSELWNGNFGLLSNQNTKNDLSTGYEVFFCPEDKCGDAYLKYIGNAKSQIDCMFYSFTLDNVGQLMKEKADKNVNIRIVFDDSQIGQGSEYYNFKDSKIQFIQSKGAGIVHHKFCIFDQNIVSTGSFNPSKHADQENDESLLFINNKQVAKTYQDYFDRKWIEWKDQNKSS